MRNFVGYLVFFYLFVCPKQAEAVTISGYFDYYMVVENLPSILAADSQMIDFIANGEKILNDMRLAMDDFQTCWPEPDTLKWREKQICRVISLEEQWNLLEYKTRVLYNDFETMNLLLYCPIEENLEIAIRNVAVRENLSALIDCSIPGFISEVDAVDFTEEVRVELIRLEKARTGLE